MRTTNNTIGILAILALLLLSPLASAELIINRHSVDFVASSPYNEQLKLCAGETKTDIVTVENTGTFPAEYMVEVRSDWPGVIRAPQLRVTLDPWEQHSFPIYIEQSAGITGEFAYEVTVANEYGRIERLQRTIRSDRCQTAAMSVEPDARELGLCEPTSVRVTVQNVGPYAQHYALHFGPYESIVQADNEFRLEAGKTYAQNVNLTFACDEYGQRVFPVDLFTEDGMLAAQDSVAFSIRNEYGVTLDVPTSTTVCAQTTAILPVGVSNDAPVADEFRIVLDAPRFASLRDGARETTLTLGGDESVDVPVTIAPNADDLGEYALRVSVDDRFGDVTKSREIALTVENCYAPAVEVRLALDGPAATTDVACCGEKTYLVNVRNDGTREQAFQLAVDGPDFFELDETTVRVRPGENVNVPLRADLPCTDETYDATVKVWPVGQEHIAASATFSVESQTQRTCHMVAIDDDELDVREDADVVPVIVKHLGIAGGTYDIDLDNDLFSVEESQITLQPGEQKAIHLIPKTDLTAEPKGRYILQPGFSLDELDYNEHVGIELEGRGWFARAIDWLRGLPWCTVGTCGWTTLVLFAVLVALVLALVLVYLGKLTLFPEGLSRVTLMWIKTILVVLLALALVWLAVQGTPTPEMTYERVADGAEPTVIEWYQNDQKIVDLDAYFTDPDLDVLSYTATQPSDITAGIDGSTLTLVPDRNWVGENTLVVTASDAKGGLTDSPTFVLRVIPKKDLGFLETLRVWCTQIIATLLVAILVVLLLLAIGVKEKRANDPRGNVIVVVPRPAKKRVAKKAARKVARARVAPARTARVTSTAVYLAAKDGNTVHAPDCVVARRIPKGRRVAYSSKGAAVKAKLVPCRLCRPFEGGI